MDDDLENTSELEENVTKFLDVGCECSGGPEGSPCGHVHKYSPKRRYFLT